MSEQGSAPFSSYNPLKESIEALVRALDGLLASLKKEKDIFGWVGKPVAKRYELEMEVLSPIRERLKNMVAACEGRYPADLLRESYEDFWKEEINGKIQAVRATGEKRWPMTSHGFAWVQLCHETEKIVIRTLDEG